MMLLQSADPIPGLVYLSPPAVGAAAGDLGVVVGAISALNTYAPVFVGAFLTTLIATPLVHRVATLAGIIDKPDQQRKHHSYPIAYLGGTAVFLGLLVGLAISYVGISGPAADLPPVPIAVIAGMVAIAFTGLADDIWKWDPRLKIAGQLVAAAALAAQEVGTGVASGLLQPILGNSDQVLAGFGWAELTNGQLYYWIGTALVAVFVLGGCNSANLIDGLDGLLTGTGVIMSLGLIIIALLMAAKLPVDDIETTQVAARVVLPLVLMGALLGFLPWNFNPAVIFLGDCGSLLIGYCLVTSIMLFAEVGYTSLVFAGLIVFALPILDTMLAIVRRKVAGLPMSTPDANHLHHQLKRALGSVRKAVLALYGITICFTGLGIGLAAMVLMTQMRTLIVYGIISVIFLSIVVYAYKIARIGSFSAQARGEES
ncbi:MAG: undecaprenyl/decaprenyl-phosphate alpha-N-acetylglucosaminyl 1-phosphate transferase [Phycisphaerales bacterium]|nr:undecaprenyl/decaprenyl-phosphate alpha-N-acetylglucosaminyl 1-phosphate transferase [Phycisphaerales bacterium]